MKVDMYAPLKAFTGFDKMTVARLRTICTEAGTPIRSYETKEALIGLIKENLEDTRTFAIISGLHKDLVSKAEKEIEEKLHALSKSTA